MKLKIQMLRLDSSFINGTNKLLSLQTWDVISTFLYDIGIISKNSGLFKTSDFIRLVYLLMQCHQSKKSQLENGPTLSTLKDTRRLPTKQIRTKCFPWKTGTNIRHTSRHSAATTLRPPFSNCTFAVKCMEDTDMKQLYEEGGTTKAYLNSCPSQCERQMLPVLSAATFLG